MAGLCPFTGRVSDVSLCRVLSSADVGVGPDPKGHWSRQEHDEQIMEYMFFSLPIVAIDLTEHRVSARSAALFADPNRERALAGCISELLDDPAAGSGWAGPAASGCRRTWPGSTRPRCCWPPMSGCGRRQAAPTPSPWTTFGRSVGGEPDVAVTQVPQQPLLSVTMPTRNRPELFERALRSVVAAVTPVAREVEVAVSDGSDDDASGAVVHRLLAGWPGRHRYVWNQPPLPLVENLNRAFEISTGEWVMQLHDDDYLLPGAGEAMLEAIRRAGSSEAMLLFGVKIVGLDGRRRREQRFRRERYLEPKQALRRLLCNSSFVRQPAAVSRRTAMEEEGLLDTSVGGASDTDMWVRLFSRYGVRCLPQATCAYTIHEAAATTGMWNPGTIRASAEIFDRAVARGVVPEPTIRRWQADCYHQFILAGAYRRLRLGRRAEAREVLRLFDLPEVRDVGVSPKWLPVRAAFTAATSGVRRRTS